MSSVYRRLTCRTWIWISRDVSSGIFFTMDEDVFAFVGFFLGLVERTPWRVYAMCPIIV